MKPAVIVETNFVVQVVSRRGGQDQVAAVETILNRAKAGDLLLAIPAFSLMEAQFVLRQAEKRRNRLSNSLAAEETELRRSPTSMRAADELATFRSTLVTIQGEESVAYNDLLETFLNHGTLIGLDRDVIHDLTIYQHERPLSLTDNVVFHSVVRFLSTLGEERSPRLFLNYNKADFDHEDVREWLARFGVRLCTDARAVVAALDRELDPST